TSIGLGARTRGQGNAARSRWKACLTSLRVSNTLYTREEPGAGVAGRRRAVARGARRRCRRLPTDDQLDRERPLPAFAPIGHRSRSLLRHFRGSDLPTRRQGALMTSRAVAKGHRGAAAAILLTG